MADEAFLHGLLKDAAQSFAAKAKERHEANKLSPNSQAKFMQSIGITSEEKPNYEQPVQVASPTTVVAPAPAKNHRSQVTKTNSGSGSNKQGKKSVSFAAFSYTDAIAIFFTHRRIFKNMTDDYEHLGVGAIVFSEAADKVLLVQRAGADPLGGKWETPGGLCEDRDMTILHGLVRELFEGTKLGLTSRAWAFASGLAAKRVEATIGYHDLKILSGQRCRKYAFVVELGAYRAVSLDPEKYQRYVWASEQDIAMGWCEGHHLEFTVAEERIHIVRAFQEKDEEAD
ncbi:hypothetical protein PG996_004125 [Apiospora saccharicola]|uniref:Nudix hydrolase domain-containing protein n=1 Tax=Apiospora saccharicola TaxID=335842 RepID=A0ABR1W3A0_9PEZI